MKNLTVFLILFFAIASSSFSQSRWIQINSIPDPGARYEDMYFVNAKTGYVVHGIGRIYKTTDGGKNFGLKTNRPGGGFRSTGFFDESTGVIGTLNDTAALLRTTNSGVNWTNVTNFNGTYPVGICGISIVDSLTAFGVGIYACPPHFLKTLDKGFSWTSVNLDTHLVKSLVDCYFWSRDSGIVIGGYNPFLNNWGISNAVILFTSNGGASFTQVFKSTRTGEWGWKISFVNKTTGFVAVENENIAVVLKTTNMGMNWSEASVTTVTFNLEGIGFINENTGWMGGWGGPTYMTTNSGTNWVQAPWGRFVNRFRFISDTLGYCIGQGFYKFTQEGVGVSQISEVIPEKFYLRQNYPNPFNPSTRINYEIRAFGLVTLTVYDTKGNEAALLVNENQRPGIYSVEFDGASLPSGIYYYKLTVNNFTDTRKMVLVK